MGSTITINGEKYHIKAVVCYEEKVALKDNMLGLKVGIEVRRLSDDKILMWEELRRTYIGEKITDYIYNTINGQRTFYWDWNKTRR